MVKMLWSNLSNIEQCDTDDNVTLKTIVPLITSMLSYRLTLATWYLMIQVIHHCMLEREKPAMSLLTNIF